MMAIRTFYCCLLLIFCPAAGWSLASTAYAGDVIKIGYYGPLSGGLASWGQNSLAGVRLAAQETNQKGGINGKRVEILHRDDKCSAAGKAVAQELIEAGVSALLGPICSGSGASALPLTQAKGIPSVVIAASAPDLTAIGDLIFRVYPSCGVQGKVAAGYLFNNQGYKKAACFYVKNKYGEGIYNVFKSTYQELGGQITFEKGAGEKATDFVNDLKQAVATEPDVLYLATYPGNTIALFKQIKELGIKIPAIGVDAFAGKEVVQSGHTEGAVFSRPKINNPPEFQDRIKALPDFKAKDVAIAAPLGYDASMVLFAAIQKGGDDPLAIRDALQATKYKGISNDTITFDSQGDLEKAAYNWMIIQDKKVVPFKK